jgi:hypothetical protein
MIFKNKLHENNFFIVLEKMKNQDAYHTSVAYLLTLDSVCFRHIGKLFDFAEGCIKPDGINAEWQTGTSKQTTRLMFNLWNGYRDEMTTPDNLFCSDYAPYYWQAICLRFGGQNEN